MQELPTVKAAADASPDKIHKLWEGLGYYTRVRNLQKAARQIIAQHAVISKPRRRRGNEAQSKKSAIRSRFNAKAQRSKDARGEIIGKDAFHRVPDCSGKDGDAVERLI
jgi:hypothetical protein